MLGAGTTGSGRKLVGHVIGADLVVNEITAHLSGAAHVDPNVDTIFEIGGQDSKYICAKDGRIFDSNMNYVCAAGTGSFVEEQAKKLGLKLEEIGDVVMGIAPPVTSDRCTVFMEQDVDRLLRQGYTREECMAAVLCSVVKNYFTKVVGRRRVSRERIFFQGATARNKGLVAAFENLMNVEMVVSPYCHVMGSYGAALLVKRAIEGKAQPVQGPGPLAPQHRPAQRAVHPLREPLQDHVRRDRGRIRAAELGLHVRPRPGRGARARPPRVRAVPEAPRPALPPPKTRGEPRAPATPRHAGPALKRSASRAA